MQVQVQREACCAQDDQLGPLEATYELAQGATIADLVSAIVGSHFLQYSPSHTCLVGFVGAEPFVRVFSPDHTGGRKPEFTQPSTRLVTAVVGNEAVVFRFL